MVLNLFIWDVWLIKKVFWAEEDFLLLGKSYKHPFLSSRIKCKKEKSFSTQNYIYNKLLLSNYPLFMKWLSVFENAEATHGEENI